MGWSTASLVNLRRELRFASLRRREENCQGLLASVECNNEPVSGPRRDEGYRVLSCRFIKNATSWGKRAERKITRCPTRIVGIVQYAESGVSIRHSYSDDETLTGR